MTRLTWDECWMQVAEVIAQRSLCARFRTGAVIVSKKNRIVATGYIGPPAGFAWPDHPSRITSCRDFCERGANGPTEDTALSYADCVSIHSEQNALLVCDRDARERGTIYVTSGPCIQCAKSIANSGLARAVVQHSDLHPYRQLDLSYDFMRSSGLQVDVVRAPDDPSTTTYVPREPKQAARRRLR